MRVLFLTSYPSPYRVDFFNLLGKYVELTVAFTERPEAQKHRSQKWFNTDYSGFRAIFLEKPLYIRGTIIYKDVFALIKDHYDFIVLGGYSSGTQMAAIEYMRFHRIPFILEADGGLVREETKLKYLIKRHFIRSAKWWFGTGSTTIKYFCHYGAKREAIYTYPFTSQWKRDLVAEQEDTEDNVQAEGDKPFNDLAFQTYKQSKRFFKTKLGISEPRMILTVGQLVHRKGIDVLLRASEKLPEDIAVCIVGGIPPAKYKKIKKELRLNHVYFEDFKTKEELSLYYRAADVFVMPTREDVWGLVINEAMSYGLPIVSTDRCVAALELVENGRNGLIVPAENPEALAGGIICILDGNLSEMRRCSLKKIQGYTLENMVKAHVDFFQAMSK